MKIAYSSANTNRYGIIFLHGIFDNSSSFKEVANELSKQHSIYLVDIINHGKADKACKMTFNLLVQKLSEIINSIKDKETVLIGHPLGGRIIMHYHYCPVKDSIKLTEVL
jgi:pimeloyl-ACP methyl ester carboxylesterase